MIATIGHTVPGVSTPTVQLAQRIVLPALTRLMPLATRAARRGLHAGASPRPVLSSPTTVPPRMAQALTPAHAAEESIGRTFRRHQSTSARSSRFQENEGSSSSFNMGDGIPNIPFDFKPPPLKYLAAAGGAAFLLYCARNSVLMTDAGITYVVQNQITGSLEIYTEPGLYRRVPFFSSVTPYRHVITATFDGRDAVTARFADTYVGQIPVTFRFKLPLHEDAIRKMHKEFRCESNLVQSLLERNAANVTVITATQYTGEEFFQGGLNKFKTQLADQLQNGIYLTERKQVEVEQTDLAPVGADMGGVEEQAGVTKGAPKLVKATQLVWKTVPVYDTSGHLQRAENPLAQYGIDVTQVLIGDPRPEDNLDRLLIDKKRLVAERIKTVQEQETSKAQARTEQLKKEIQRTKEVQDAQRQKELVVISSQREVEVAKQIAERETIEQRKLQDLAVIQKDKELAIARAELDIQKANAQAAQHAAQAIAAKGKAEAEVLSAHYKAKAQNKDIFIAETQRDIATTLYGNLKDIKVEMPQNVIVGGGDGSGSGAGKLPSNIDVITAFSALGMMEKAQRAA